MAGKLRHLRFNDETWDAWCATLPEGVSPTQGLEVLMRADIAGDAGPRVAWRDPAPRTAETFAAATADAARVARALRP